MGKFAKFIKNANETKQLYRCRHYRNIAAYAKINTDIYTNRHKHHFFMYRPRFRSEQVP